MPYESEPGKTPSKLERAQYSIGMIYHHVSHIVLGLRLAREDKEEEIIDDTQLEKAKREVMELRSLIEADKEVDELLELLNLVTAEKEKDKRFEMIEKAGELADSIRLHETELTRDLI